MSNPLTPAAWARKFYFAHGRRPTNGEYRAAYEAGEVTAVDPAQPPVRTHYEESTDFYVDEESTVLLGEDEFSEFNRAQFANRTGRSAPEGWGSSASSAGAGAAGAGGGALPPHTTGPLPPDQTGTLSYNQPTSRKPLMLTLTISLSVLIVLLALILWGVSTRTTGAQDQPAGPITTGSASASASASMSASATPSATPTPAATTTSAAPSPTATSERPPAVSGEEIQGIYSVPTSEFTDKKRAIHLVMRANNSCTMVTYSEQAERIEYPCEWKMTGKNVAITLKTSTLKFNGEIEGSTLTLSMTYQGETTTHHYAKVSSTVTDEEIAALGPGSG
ncbi:MAG: hypothetical protein Q4P78_02410 [Rothia sp. (in: high G+C Gram-positive bacteria)]|uniref:hypothetical protein n=1 Tax=Rothia sp. (in: high G+C Gram-positive bacteria) TaxID=1885016 RepID=UPI0026E0FDD0|nr:hypothetical protein [Rothia sp. (in: high G+C Gram-positive bacteria)]MDO5750040.1 hypothetical protein [Rothia sp. (in: high G+C Gram-positive bacteria)]